MKPLFTLLSIFLFINSNFGQRNQEKIINILLDDWHKAAAESNYEKYFDALDNDATFIGTDAQEYWNKTEFSAFAKPFFEKGKAWNFTPIKRHVYFSRDGKTAWFDELLDTWMKLCRGSGVLEFKNGKWKIKQYVLSMTIPNDNVETVIKTKAPLEDALLLLLKKE